MEMPDFFTGDNGLRSDAVFPSAGFAVTTQSHSFEQAVASVGRMVRSLGIKRRIEDDDLRHFAYSAKWFGKNPLMMVRLASFTGDMYENQFVYTMKIRLAAAHILMLHALLVETHGPLDPHSSTAAVNNFETLDISHYLIAEAIGRKTLSTRRVPMNVSALDLARLSDIRADLSTSGLAGSQMKRLSKGITEALKSVEQGYFDGTYIPS